MHSGTMIIIYITHPNLPLSHPVLHDAWTIVCERLHSAVHSAVLNDGISHALMHCH